MAYRGYGGYRTPPFAPRDEAAGLAKRLQALANPALAAEDPPTPTGAGTLPVRPNEPVLPAPQTPPVLEDAGRPAMPSMAQPQPLVRRDQIAGTGEIYNPQPTGNPTADLEAMMATRAALAAQPPQAKKRSVGNVLDAGFTAAAPALQNSNSLGYSTGAILAGIGGALFNPKSIGAVQRQRQLGQLDAQIAPLQQAANLQRQGETDAFNRDIRTQQLELTREQREAEFYNRQQRLNESISKRLRHRMTEKNHFDPRSLTPKERQFLKDQEGMTDEEIDASGMDRRSPQKHTINGQTFIWNPDTRKFEDSGLPRDEKYLSQLPTQEVEINGQVYKTTPDKAATIASSFRNAKLMSQAAAERQASQQGFQAGQNALTREFQGTQLKTRQEYERATEAAKGLTSLQKLIQEAQQASAKDSYGADTRAKWDAVTRAKQALRAQYGDLPQFNDALQKVAPDD